MKLNLIALLLLGIALPAQADQPTTLIGKANCRIVKSDTKRDVRATWSGPCANGFAEGTGVLVWYQKGVETLRYEGELVRGQAHGNGYSVYPGGAQYEGSYADGKREGKGIYLDYDGSRYDGSWKNGLQSGAGSFAYSNGARYDGQWKDGLFDGVGRAQYAGGQVVEGEFSAGYPSTQTRGKPDETKDYRLRADMTDERFGHSDRTLVTNKHGLAMDLPYESMTKVQKQAVRSYYPMLHANDEPPFPRKGLRSIMEWMSYVQGAVGAHGVVKAHVMVNAEGDVTSFKSYSRQPADMTKAIAMAMSSEKYKPALCDGNPCAMEFRMQIMFVPEE